MNDYDVDLARIHHETHGALARRGEPVSCTEPSAHALSMEQLFPVVYNELRQIAARKLRSERTSHTLCATALVHEAWLDLRKLNRIQWRNRTHFLAVAARSMRRILIDYAVAHRTKKRGGGLWIESLDNQDVLAIAQVRGHELMALDEALTRLSALNDRQARIVECRFYGGMSIRETADALDVSPATVKRQWADARAWLNRELRS